MGPGVDINVLDGTNVVFWAKTTIINGGFDSVSGVLGYTYTSYYDDESIAECDIVLNGAEFTWETKPTTAGGHYYIDAVLLHEIGHVVGLEHASLGGALMMARGESGVLSASFTSDEICAARYLYPDSAFLARLGSVNGRITASGNSVFGAVVTAEDHFGSAIASTVATSTGNYELPALAPDTYRIRVTPLDLNYNDPLLAGIDISQAYQQAKIDFAPTSSSPVTVTAGSSSALNISVISDTPDFRINAIRPVISEPSYFVINRIPLMLKAGQSNYWIGVYTHPSTNVSENETAQLTVSGEDVALDSFRCDIDPFGNGKYWLYSARIGIASNAVAGMRTLILNRGGRAAYANGFLKILPAIEDNNFDGLDDAFQRKYFSLWTAPEAGPNANPDLDGMNNAAEYLAGTDPTRFDLILKYQTTGDPVSGGRLSWPSIIGKTYQVDASSSFVLPVWQAVSPVITATTTNASWSWNGFSSNRIVFRVRGNH